MLYGAPRKFKCKCGTKAPNENHRARNSRRPKPAIRAPPKIGRNLIPLTESKTHLIGPFGASKGNTPPSSRKYAIYYSVELARALKSETDIGRIYRMAQVARAKGTLQGSVFRMAKSKQLNQLNPEASPPDAYSRNPSLDIAWSRKTSQNVAEPRLRPMANDQKSTHRQRQRTCRRASSIWRQDSIRPTTILRPIALTGKYQKGDVRRCTSRISSNAWRYLEIQ